MLVAAIRASRPQRHDDRGNKYGTIAIRSTCAWLGVFGKPLMICGMQRPTPPPEQDTCVDAILFGEFRNRDAPLTCRRSRRAGLRFWLPLRIPDAGLSSDPRMIPATGNDGNHRCVPIARTKDGRAPTLTYQRPVGTTCECAPTYGGHCLLLGSFHTCHLNRRDIVGSQFSEE